MTLSHRMLGQLVGARRPTVSTALGDLVRQGELTRRDDGTWLLTGKPVGIPEPDIERVIPMRRRLLPPDPPARERTAAAVVQIADRQAAQLPLRAAEMGTVLQRMREQCEFQVEELRGVFVTAAQLAERTSELRQRCRETRSASSLSKPAAGGA
jgi:hypothetical protein